ncbi:MAG: hypothetical protein KY475_11930 [Planctomycetes bacterium]|nr:hypothetical protein [Planctomycetota bacterium]
MSSSDNFIDGVFNYCDRWCERCPLTTRCRVFASEQQFREDAARSDDENAEFWSALDQVAEDSIDDEPLWVGDENDTSHESRLDKLAERDPLVQLSRDYAMAVHRWLQGHEDDFSSEDDRMRSTRDPVSPGEALEVISWHHFQISVKLARAAGGRDSAELEDEDEDKSWDAGSGWIDDEEEEIQDIVRQTHLHDADGSAKVALLGIERSIGAWTILRDAFPAEDEQIQDFQRRLARLRRMLVAEFPGARTFRRPGFDD